MSDPTFRLWEGVGNPQIDQDRKPRVMRPCTCGCGSRDRTTPEPTGYLSASKGGRGFTIEIPDEDTYQRMRLVFGGQE